MKTFNLEGAAEYLNISTETMRNMAVSGEVDCAKIGKSWVFTDEHLDEFLRKEIKAQTAARRKDQVKEDKPEAAQKSHRRQPARPPALVAASW